MLPFLRNAAGVRRLVEIVRRLDGLSVEVHAIQASSQVCGGMLSFGVPRPLAVGSGAARLIYGNGDGFQSRSPTCGNGYDI